MPKRRTVLAAGVMLALPGCKPSNPPVAKASEADPLVVNDVHSELNETRVARIERPASLAELQSAIRSARERKEVISLSGARHAMGGQQFGEGTALFDLRGLQRVLNLDSERGIVEIEAGIGWPQLVEHLIRVQEGRTNQWGIRQKQTGADGLTLGGALAANAHGRGLSMRPMIGDVESFQMVDARGEALTCSRTEHAELFRLVIGGYGLFGPVYSIRLRLSPRRKVRRVVEVRRIDALMAAFADRIRDGFLYGDFQFAIDPKSPDFLRTGVFSCYEPVPMETALHKEPKRASEEDWLKMVTVAHEHPSRAYDAYVKAYLSTNGQIYWSDTHQLGTYVAGYHRKVSEKLKARHPATEVITEIYVPRERFTHFMEEASADFRRNDVALIYGTVRLIEKDDESFLPWAREPYACVIFNLHTEHTPEGLKHSASAFRRLIDMGIRHGGSYYLTYHRYATREQVTSCYPRFGEFLERKRHYDPDERFQSEWYRHYRRLFTAAKLDTNES